MRRGAFWGMLVSGLLFAAVPGGATIQVNLENPIDGQDISGIVTISGWAFSTMPNNAVTVTLTIDGNTTVGIPCCGPRSDVQAQNPDAPLNTAFSLLFNYGILSAGPHTFRVEVSAPGEQTESRQVTVSVAKPADAQFLSNFALPTNATVAADANEIVIVGAQVTPQGGSPTKVNLRVRYATNLQSPVITEAFAGTNAQLFDPVQTIFTNRCAVPGCHVGPNPTAEQNLSANNSFTNIVAVRSVENPALLRVSPGDADGSYLYQKIIPNGQIAPNTGRMPLGGTPLSDAEIKTIEDWINAGAPSPQ